MKYVVQYTEGFGRERYLVEMKKQIPDLQIVEDVDKTFLPKKGMKSGMFYFLKSIDFIEPFVHFEDDAILCKDFKKRAESLIQNDPNCLHQFFTMRQSDYEAGSRYVSGYKFLCNVCIYFPRGMGHDIVVFYYDKWRNSRSGMENPTGFDTLIADYLKFRKLKYFVHVPCLAQHAEGKSAINSKRSSKRQTKMFIDDLK